MTYCHGVVLGACRGVAFVLDPTAAPLHGSPPLQKAEESQQRQEAFLEQKLAQHNKASWASTTKKQSVALCTLVLCPLHVCV